MGLFVDSLELASKSSRVIVEAAPEAAALSRQVFHNSLSEVFTHPQKLIDVLPQLAEIFAKRGIEDASGNLSEISRLLTKRDPIAGMKVTRFLGTGSGDFTLATENGTALKLGADKLPRIIPNPVFDAPVVAHGRLGEQFYYYQQPIGNTVTVTDQHVLKVISNIRKEGYYEDDLWGTVGTRRDQVALFGAQQRPLLIDQGSAVPRYGTVYENGRLLTHAQQQANLGEVKEFLDSRSISLTPASETALSNPWRSTRTIAAAIDDEPLKDKVLGHLETIDQPPTLSRRWTASEVEMALRSLTFKK